ncbi:sorting nexin-31 [Protopterus annectens]|uniref:sorting nexin-31 n=1 Tax=Protopterus annectens TaxID=7888 RepID=UPI001CFB9851|nr:sorting nexin-31 [Protopterus annectens]
MGVSKPTTIPPVLEALLDAFFTVSLSPESQPPSPKNPDRFNKVLDSVKFLYINPPSDPSVITLYTQKPSKFLSFNVLESAKAQEEDWEQEGPAEPPRKPWRMVLAKPVLALENTFNLYRLVKETFLVPKKLVGFDVFLPDGEKVLVDMQSTDTAERLLQLVAHRIRLSRELSAYFALFVIHEYEDGSYSVLKKLAEFELPFVIPWSTGDKHSKIVIRKWYMDPGLDEMFFESSAGLYLLYAQAVHDLKEGRMKPTDEQLKQLKMLEEAENKKEYLKVMQQVEYYGCMQFDTCVYKNQMVDHPAVVRVGKDVINCNIRLPNNQLEEIDFTIRRMKCWRIRLMGEFLNGQNKDAVHNMEVSFEYCNANNSWTWITFYTDQAFLLSNCIQQMVAEHLPKNSIGNMEMLTETPESESMITQITRRLQFLQFEGSSTALGKFVSSFKVKREQNASEDVQDEDL